MNKAFQLESKFEPAGDQPQAINKLTNGVLNKVEHQTLLGVTGSGKTFTMAHLIQNTQKPTLIMAPNKTLAAQLYGEMKAFFPNNAVEYFVSYYDYYQPEAYVPASDTYIEKDSSINEHIEQMRLSATKALLERKDVVIVATVSAIYGLGAPENYLKMILHLTKSDVTSQRKILRRLSELQYTRNDLELGRGNYRVNGDIIDVFPADSEKYAVRIELFGDDVDDLAIFDPLTGEIIERLQRVTIYPKSHYVTGRQEVLNAIDAIKLELKERLEELRLNNKLVEEQRLKQRTEYDLEMLQELGFCTGIENYSRHLTGRKPGESPPTLLDYLPKDALLILDESHIMVPQLGAMYKGDRARKQNLVEYGFRLPSALDNRPLKFEEFEQIAPQVIYVSATPGNYELSLSNNNIAEQIVRPTGLIDPQIEVRPVNTQVDDVLSEIHKRVKINERVLITTLTKKMAENLTEYLAEHKVKVRYLHSDIDTVERVEIIRDLRIGAFDVLVGINLLREGLDMPEVSLVAIFDADKEGFLRSNRSLIQTIGRAARNINGEVIMYADVITPSMRQAIDETSRRRKKQAKFNQEHNITPASIQKSVADIMQGEKFLIRTKSKSAKANKKSSIEQKSEKLLASNKTAQEINQFIEQAKFQSHYPNNKEMAKYIKQWDKAMHSYAEDLDFENAAIVRDCLNAIKELWFKI